MRYEELMAALRGRPNAATFVHCYDAVRRH